VVHHVEERLRVDVCGLRNWVAVKYPSCTVYTLLGHVKKTSSLQQSTHVVTMPLPSLKNRLKLNCWAWICTGFRSCEAHAPGLCSCC
jgi:hypothetical protein